MATISLRNCLQTGSELIVKYSFYIRIEKEHKPSDLVVLASAGRGSFSVNPIIYSAKISSLNMLLIPCSASKLDNMTSGGKKLIKVRNFLFYNAQLYVKRGTQPVLKAKETTGVLYIKISDKGFRHIKKQLWRK